MKNIHLIPTTKEQHAIIQKNTGLLLVQTRDKVYTGTKLNIYITSDEEIKEGDWVLGGLGGVDIKKYGRYFADDWKKIILTTDQNLIKDGVQAIDDDFLEWFVKNPSCEEVKVRKNPKVSFIVKGKGVQSFNQGYKIIIPKEEPKIELYMPKYTIGNEPTNEQEEPKQETLEEAAEKNYENKTAQIPVPTSHWVDSKRLQIQNFIEGAKSDAARDYWFKQFKKD
jgi:hypothetical protein